MNDFSLKDFALRGFEDLELSTQIIIREAMSREIQVEVLDRPGNFIRLRKGDKTELIKQASKTRLDSYMTYLVMENKAVTKILLNEAGVSVPKGGQYFSKEEALNDFQKFQDKKVVVKPLTTNFGIGISFLEAGFTKESFSNVVEKTLTFDNSFLVEEFLEGEEYRFLVIDYKLIAVCKRVPANVLGDGESSIEELVAEKNKDPRRGRNHTKPLEIIELGDTEVSYLKEQGLEISSVTKNNKQVFLRENSNISTGGDSLDMTDQVPSSYKKIAEKAASAAKSRVCGVDMLIKDISDEATPLNQGIVELNFNPVLFIHNYPYQGKDRQVGKYLLDALGF